MSDENRSTLVFFVNGKKVSEINFLFLIIHKLSLNKLTKTFDVNLTNQL